ncbi:MAG: cell division protein FtsA [Odoribacter sp.]|nr:cell division protein FtsA [Odoribacter sp.]
MESRYIAAIEIGSSKIKGIVASVDPTAAISVIAIEETDTAESVRHGRVQNAREAAERVNDIIRRLENNPRLAGGRLTSVYVSNGGRSVDSRAVESDVRLGGDVEITAQVLEKLHNEARYNLATDRDVLYIGDRRFMVDGTEVKRIIGSFGNAIHGEFTIVTASVENRRNLDRVKIESHGADIPRHYIPRPVAIADMLLSDSERQLGTLLVDLGAETTTVAIYKASALQLLATLPMGSANITRDLSQGLGITAEAAENIKLTRGRAVADRVKNVEADPETAEITNYISARAGEIIANIINYIDQSGINLSDLPGGIVLTGGGSRLKGFDEMLEAQTKLKVRHAAIDATIGGAPFNNPDNADVIALVKYAAAHDGDNASCIELPSTAGTRQATSTAGATGPAAGQREPIDENDPRLLYDDEPFDQPDNIVDDELPEPGANAGETRDNLLKRIANWLTKPKDADLDSDSESLD